MNGLNVVVRLVSSNSSPVVFLVAGARMLTLTVYL